MGMSIKEAKNLQPGPQIKRQTKMVCAHVGGGDNMSVRAFVFHCRRVVFKGLVCVACLLRAGLPEMQRFFLYKKVKKKKKKKKQNSKNLFHC